MSDSAKRYGFQKFKEGNPQANFIESIEDYHKQADQVFIIINEIESFCILSWQNHKILHKYLNLLLKDVRVMKGNNLELAKKAKSKLVEKITIFLLYFENK